MGRDRVPERPRAKLRRQAKKRLQEKFPAVQDVSSLTREKVEHLVHELHVHQIELEVQSEELRRSQTELERLKDKYVDLYDFAPVGYITLGETGLILDANLTACHLLGYWRKSLIDTPFSRYIWPEDQDGFYLFVQELLQSKPRQSCDVRLVKKNGEVFHSQLESTLGRVEEGEIEQWRMVISDITERKIAEEQVKAALTEKEVLLREIHHRVANNLAVIHSLLRIRAKFSTDISPKDIFQEINTRIRSMAITHEILCRSDNVATLRTSEYVGTLVGHICHSYDTVGSRVSVNQRIEDVSCKTDSAIPLGLLLTELLSNCYKHAFPNGGKGEISVNLIRSVDNTVELTVKDNGVGLPKDIDLKSPKTMGLRLVARFVEQLQGEYEIRVEDGTEVCVRFPIGRLTEDRMIQSGYIAAGGQDV